MNEKKLFGIGAVVLLVFVAFAPAINGLQVDSEKTNVFENEISPAGAGDWDLKITFIEAVFDHYHETEDIVYYKITYAIENIGEGVYIGWPKAKLRVHEKDWVIASWDWPGKLLTLRKGDDPVTAEIVKDIDFDDEIYFAGRIADLEVGLRDQHGLEDPNKGNNVDFETGNFWEILNSRGHEPNGNHYEACRPHEQWVDHYEEIEFPDENKTIVLVPIFKDVYANFIIPRFLGSDRLGWLGKTVDLLIDAGRALCNCSAAILEALSCVVLLIGEVYAGILGIIALVEGIASGNIVLGFAVVSALFLDLAAICVTLELLLAAIEDIPEQGDPEVEELERAMYEFLSYMSTYPWTHGISIFGEINNCKSGEKVEISCRDVENRNIPGGEGKRDIEAFDVDSSFELAKLDHLIVRNCQVTITGDQHTNSRNAKPIVGQKPLKTRRMFSYVAPGGSLQVIGGFKPKGRSVNLPVFNFLRQLLERFPLLKQILSPYFFPITV